VEELSADGADHALDKRVLPGRARSCEKLGDADGLHPSAKLGAIDAVAIAQQIAGRRIIGERLDDLSRGPGGGWGISHIEKRDSAAWMQQEDEHVEHTEGRRRHHEEVDRGEIGDVVLKAQSPKEKSAPFCRAERGSPTEGLGWERFIEVLRLTARQSSPSNAQASSGTDSRPLPCFLVVS